MKTTIDLPEELLRRTEAEAAVRGMKVEDLVAQLLENAFPAPKAVTQQEKGIKTPFPVVFPKTGQVVRSFTNGELDEIELADIMEKASGA